MAEQHEHLEGNEENYPGSAPVALPLVVTFGLVAALGALVIAAGEVFGW